MHRVAIVIPVYNKKKTTLNCLERLYSEGLPGKYQVIIVDSGSTDGMETAVLARYPDTIVLKTNQDAWWAEATNIGVKKGIDLKCDYILTYNNDSYATFNTLDDLVKTAENNPDTIVSPVICYADKPDTVMFAGRQRARYTDRYVFMDHNEPYSHLERQLRTVELSTTMCTLFPVGVFKNTGLFNSDAYPHYYADDDLLIRARQSGYQLIVDTNLVILNDRKETGITPYTDRLGPRDIYSLLTSKKSVYQVSKRSKFYWQHRTSIPRFFFTWTLDYTRIMLIVICRWIFPARVFQGLLLSGSRIFQK